MIPAQWPPSEFIAAAKQLSEVAEGLYRQENINPQSLRASFIALCEQYDKYIAGQPMPEYTGKRGILGPKMLEDCQAICQLKGEPHGKSNPTT